MSKSKILLILFAAALFYGILAMGIPIAQEHMGDRQRRDIFLLAVGLLGCFWVFPGIRAAENKRTDDRITVWAALALPAYILLQIIPLPVMLVSALSPERGALLRAVEPVTGHAVWASLSITPSLSFTHFLLFASYSILFLAAREFSSTEGEGIWLVAAPVAIAGIIESVLALIQASAGPDTPPTGTFGVRNHLAGFLAMAWPLPAMFGISRFRAGRRSSRKSLLVQAIAALLVALLMIMGTFSTASRGGFAGVAASIFVMIAFSVGRDMRPKRRIALLIALFAAVIVGLFVVTPEALIARLSEHTSEGRTTIWRQGLGVVKAFPLFGAGMGGFESAFLKFKAGQGTFLVDYVHNDYLQYLAELGAIGFIIASVLIGSILIRSMRRAGEVGDARWMGLACLGSLVAILVHSFVDFNLYVAANAAVLAWICGIADGLKPSAPRLIRRRKGAHMREGAPDGFSVPR